MVVMTKQLNLSEHRRYDKNFVHAAFLKTLIDIFQHMDAYKEMFPFLMSRTNQLNQEFAFMPTQPPHAEGGIFELRTYALQPGTLLEWENSWYVISVGNAFFPYLVCEIKGEEVSRPDVNLLPQWVHGSPKSGHFTKYTICGNIRERCPFPFFANATHKRFHDAEIYRHEGTSGRKRGRTMDGQRPFRRQGFPCH